MSPEQRPDAVVLGEGQGGGHEVPIWGFSGTHTSRFVLDWRNRGPGTGAWAPPLLKPEQIFSFRGGVVSAQPLPRPNPHELNTPQAPKTGPQ